MFVCIDGQSVNMDHVLSYRVTARRKNDWDVYALRMIDGSTISGSVDGRSLDAASCEIVAAGPGYYALDCGCDTDSPDSFWHSKEPVVAWRVGPDNGDVAPVTLFGSEPMAVLDPDGYVTQIGDCRYDDIGKWMAARKEEIIRERERRKQSAPA